MRWTEGLALPAGIQGLLAALVDVELPGEPVYVAGGFVRDLLASREPRDLDVVVVGSGTALARRLGERLAVHSRVHLPFDTAELRLGKLRVDVASARRERYPAPGALPVVEPAGLEPDLARRDFTLNAMALPLAAASLTELLDPHQGRAALAERRLTVLHAESFGDDPTRILRGLELAARLGLRFDRETEALARRDAAYLTALSPSRLLEAWSRLFLDTQSLIEKLASLDGLGVLGILAPGLPDLRRTAPERLVSALAAPGGAPAAVGETILAWLARRGGPSHELALATRFGRRELVGLGARLGRAELELAKRQAPQELEQAAAHLEESELRVLSATASPAVARRAESVLSHWRPMRLGIGGADLLAAGWPPGPRIGEALSRTRKARLEGEISAGQELEFALEWLARGEAE